MGHRNQCRPGAFLVVALSLLFSIRAEATGAQPGTGGEEKTSRADQARVEDVSLEYSGTAGVSLLAGAIAAAALPSLYQTPPSCRWCSGESPNVIDRWARKARWEDPCRAGGLSNRTLGIAAAMALLPMSHNASHREWLVNAGR